MSIFSDATQKTFARKVIAMAAGESVVIDARGMSRLTVIGGTGATVTVSRVDSDDAATHTTGSENAFTVAAITRTVTDVDWAFFRISTASGPCRISIV